MAQFPKENRNVLDGSTLTGATTPPKLAPVTPSTLSQPAGAPVPSTAQKPTPQPTRTPAADDTLIGSAKVDTDGLAPLERLRALRKEDKL